MCIERRSALGVAVLLMLQRPAVGGYVPPISSETWRDSEACDAFAQDFYEVRAVIERRLSDEAVSRAAGAIGYALKQVLCGEELSEPFVLRSYRAGMTTLLFAYDSTKSRRDDPDFALAFSLAAQYIASGSPLRLSNRAGAGTLGTRLVEGIGPVSVRFAVR